MIATDSHILIFGAGSIGERHLGVLQKLGYTNLWVYRQRNLPLRTLDSSDFHIVTDLSALNEIAFKAAIVCTPTAQHLDQALWCVRRQIPVLIEKPLSHSLDGFQELKGRAEGTPNARPGGLYAALSSVLSKNKKMGKKR